MKTKAEAIERPEVGDTYQRGNQTIEIWAVRDGRVMFGQSTQRVPTGWMSLDEFRRQVAGEKVKFLGGSDE